MRTDFISEITGAASEGLWNSSGIFAVEHVLTGRRYYVGTSNVGRRFRDNRDWLRRGVHKNAALQADWAQHSNYFRFVLVARTAVKPLLPMLKQCWIDVDRRDHPLGAYNAQNAVAKARPKISAMDLSLPSTFLKEAPVHSDPFAPLVRVLGGDAFNGKAWDDHPRPKSAPTGNTWNDWQEKLAFLLGGLPSARRDLDGRVDELLRRVHQLLDAEE